MGFFLVVFIVVFFFLPHQVILRDYNWLYDQWSHLEGLWVSFLVLGKKSPLITHSAYYSISVPIILCDMHILFLNKETYFDSLFHKIKRLRSYYFLKASLVLLPNHFWIFLLFFFKTSNKVKTYFLVIYLPLVS